MASSPRRYEELSGSDRAAALLLALPQEESASVLRMLREMHLEKITTKLVQFDQVHPDVQEQILREAHEQTSAQLFIRQGGVDYARDLLGQALGAEKANHIIDKLLAKLEATPFHYLDGVEPSQIAAFLNNEHPQIVALILSYLSSGQSAAILGMLPEKLQPQVSLRLANMEASSPTIVAQVEDAFKRKLSAVLNAETRNKTGGIDFLVSVLTQVDRTTERSIMDQLEQTAPELADDIKKRMFVFENLVQLDDRSVQRVLREIDNRDLALALRGTTAAVRDHVFRNMSSRAAATVREDIESSPPMRLRNIEEAQQRIVDVVRRLEEEEEIVVSRGSGDILL